ncbi:MAG: apolipoprotein N-acyltransferase [Acetobacteraceae bacterium]|nr:apolipoprotein N-acyltransferase [Acetobacteraceae bacterium]
MTFPRSWIEARGLRADLIAVLAGALTAMALPPLHIVPCLLVAFPLLLARIDVAKGWFAAARQGWWFGFGHHLIGLYWITEAILIEAARYWWLVPLAVPALAALLAIFIAIPVALAWFFAPGLARVATLAGAWGLADLARQFVATGFPWNPLGSIWAMPGFAGDVMIQPAALVSVHGLTLATVCLACAPALNWRGRGLCLCLALAWIGFGITRTLAPPPPDQAIQVVLVQGNVPQGQKWDPAFLLTVFERYLHLTDEGAGAAGQGPRVVVWPETASPFQLATDRAAREAIANASHGSLVLAGAVRFDEADRPRNAVFAIAGAGIISALYDKWHLVPFGEYQPNWIPIGIQLVPGGGFARGPGPQTLHFPAVPPVGPLICYEAIFPGQVVDEDDRPTWMVNMTNDAWFGTSSGPRQHLAAARLRAVEEGLPLLRAANTGITAGFDSRGHEITRLSMGQTGFRTVTLPGPLPPTFFARFGLMVPGLLALSLVAVGLLTTQLRWYRG